MNDAKSWFFWCTTLKRIVILDITLENNSIVQRSKLTTFKSVRPKQTWMAIWWSLVSPSLEGRGTSESKSKSKFNTSRVPCRVVDSNWSTLRWLRILARSANRQPDLYGGYNYRPAQQLSTVRKTSRYCPRLTTSQSKSPHRHRHRHRRRRRRVTGYPPHRGHWSRISTVARPRLRLMAESECATTIDETIWMRLIENNLPKCKSIWQSQNTAKLSADTFIGSLMVSAYRTSVALPLLRFPLFVVITTINQFIRKRRGGKSSRHATDCAPELLTVCRLKQDRVFPERFILDPKVM